jgi:hypothetical protein
MHYIKKEIGLVSKWIYYLWSVASTAKGWQEEEMGKEEKKKGRKV